MPSIRKSPWAKLIDPHDAEDQAEPDAHQAVDRAHEETGGKRLQKILHQDPEVAHSSPCSRLGHRVTILRQMDAIVETPDQQSCSRSDASFDALRLLRMRRIFVLHKLSSS